MKRANGKSDRGHTARHTSMAEQPELSGLNSTGQTAVYRLITYVVSYSIWLLEKFFDAHKEEVTSALHNQKSGSLRWYRKKALDYQDGFDLLPGSDRFNNEGATEEDIEKSKIVKYAAVTEAEGKSQLIVKAAGEQHGKLVQLSPSQTYRFKTYIKEIRYAGTPVNVISLPPRPALSEYRYLSRPADFGRKGGESAKR